MSENSTNLEFIKVIKHWIETSDNDFKTMLSLYDTGSYGWSLFLGHISLEKLLKALYVKRFNEHAPFTHNLYRLSELIGLQISDEYSDWLDEITSFNINARYDDFKKEFFILCTPAYTQRWIESIKILREWIKQML